MWRRRGITAIGPDKVRPTESQIRHGLIVIPSSFLAANLNKLTWNGFSVDFLGQQLESRHIDQDNRIRLPLKEHIKFGDTLQLTIESGNRLRITKV